MERPEACDNSLDSINCALSVAEQGEYDAVATTRAIIASLSILGTLTIIILAIGRRQVFKTKIHPIFVLSLADFTLATLWIIGGGLWLRRLPDDRKIVCLVVSLITVIVQCITINMTLIYAILAYQSLKKSRLTATEQEKRSLLVSSENVETLLLETVWKKSVTIGVYAIAWITPAILVLITFSIVVGSSSDIVISTSSCSCWCVPTYGNVLPAAHSRSNATARYAYSIQKLILSYGVIISLHYLVVFTLLVVIYRKTLRLITDLRVEFERTHHNYRYTATTASIINSQSSAKRRVLLFLVIFITNGFFNFILSICLVVYESFAVHRGPQMVSKDIEKYANLPQQKAFVIILMLQSLTLPLQGFMNTIVYGWTRREFVDHMALRALDLRHRELDDDDEIEEEGSQSGRAMTGKRDKMSSFHRGAQAYKTHITESLQSIENEQCLTDTEEVYHN